LVFVSFCGGTAVAGDAVGVANVVGGNPRNTAHQTNFRVEQLSNRNAIDVSEEKMFSCFERGAEMIDRWFAYCCYVGKYDTEIVKDLCKEKDICAWYLYGRYLLEGKGVPGKNLDAASRIFQYLVKKTDDPRSVFLGNRGIDLMGLMED
jgi:hypothetical protein